MSLVYVGRRHVPIDPMDCGFAEKAVSANQIGKLAGLREAQGGCPRRLRKELFLAG